MDEKVIVNLGFFFTSSTCPYYSIASMYYSIACSHKPFPPVNKLPNKLPPKYKVTYLKILLFAL